MYYIVVIKIDIEINVLFMQTLQDQCENVFCVDKCSALHKYKFEINIIIIYTPKHSCQT